MRNLGDDNNRVMSHFRFPTKMIKGLEAEKKRTGRDKTKLLEIAFAHYMAVKADERSRLNPRL